MGRVGPKQACAECQGSHAAGRRLVGRASGKMHHMCIAFLVLLQMLCIFLFSFKLILSGQTLSRHQLFPSSLTKVPRHISKRKHASPHVHTPVRQRRFERRKKKAVLCMISSLVFFQRDHAGGCDEIFITQLTSNIFHLLYCK